MTATSVPPLRPRRRDPDALLARVAPAADKRGRHLLAALVSAARPQQWIKNASVLMVPGLLIATIGVGGIGRALAVTLAFCLASSSVYLLNDTLDREQDRHHPVKRNRPIASGRVRPREALAASSALALVASLLGWAVAPGAGLAIVAYLAATGAYSVRLKRIAYLDVAVLAGGFVLRVLAGAAAVPAHAPILLLVTVFAGAAFLAFGKRRAELTLLGDEAVAHRAALARYRIPALEAVIDGAMVATVLAFGLWVMTTLGGDLGVALGVVAAAGLAHSLGAQHQALRTGGGGNPTHDLMANRHLLPGLALAALVALGAGVIR